MYLTCCASSSVAAQYASTASSTYRRRHQRACAAASAHASSPPRRAPVKQLLLALAARAPESACGVAATARLLANNLAEPAPLAHVYHPRRLIGLRRVSALRTRAQRKRSTHPLHEAVRQVAVKALDLADAPALVAALERSTPQRVVRPGCGRCGSAPFLPARALARHGAAWRRRTPPPRCAGAADEQRLPRHRAARA